MSVIVTVCLHAPRKDRKRLPIALGRPRWPPRTPPLTSLDGHNNAVSKVLYLPLGLVAEKDKTGEDQAQPG